MEILALGEVLHGRVLTVLFWDKIANLPEKTDPLTGSVVPYQAGKDENTGQEKS